MTLYVKAGLMVALVVGLFGAGWYVGSLKGSAAVARLQRDQAQLTATAVMAERASSEAELNRVNAIVRGYQDAPIDPIAVHLGSRVFKYALSRCPVPQTRPDPPGAILTRTEPRGLEAALQGLVDACSRDAQRLDALIAAWPK